MNKQQATENVAAVSNRHANLYRHPSLSVCIPPRGFRPFLSAALLVLVSSTRLFAQAEPESWSIRVAALDIAGTQDTLWLRTGPEKKPVQVSLNTRVFSQPILYKGEATLLFYQNSTDASAKEAPLTIASTVLKSKSSLVMFSPSPDNKTYQVFAVSDDDFPFGSFRLVNFSQASVRTELADKTVVLEPGAADTITHQNAGKAFPVRIMATENNSPPRLIRQSSWSIIPAQKEYVIFFPNNGNGSIQIRHFVESKDDVPPK